VRAVAGDKEAAAWRTPACLAVALGTRGISPTARPGGKGRRGEVSMIYNDRDVEGVGQVHFATKGRMAVEMTAGEKGRAGRRRQQALSLSLREFLSAHADAEIAVGDGERGRPRHITACAGERGALLANELALMSSAVGGKGSERERGRRERASPLLPALALALVGVVRFPTFARARGERRESTILFLWLERALSLAGRINSRLAKSVASLSLQTETEPHREKNPGVLPFETLFRFSFRSGQD